MNGRGAQHSTVHGVGFSVEEQASTLPSQTDFGFILFSTLGWYTLWKRGTCLFFLLLFLS